MKIHNEIGFDCYNQENLKFWQEIMQTKFNKRDFGKMQMSSPIQCGLIYQKNHKKQYYFCYNDCYKLNNIAMLYFYNKYIYKNILKEIKFLSRFINVGCPDKAILELKNNLAVQKAELLNEIEKIFEGKIRTKFEFNY